MGAVTAQKRVSEVKAYQITQEDLNNPYKVGVWMCMVSENHKNADNVLFVDDGELRVGVELSPLPHLIEENELLVLEQDRFVHYTNKQFENRYQINQF